MSNTQDTTSKPTHQYSKIDTELLEPYLKLPSGLPLNQLSKQAKRIKKEQGIGLSEAIKIMLWGNGLPNVRDLSQAMPILIESTFGIPADEIAFTIEEGEINGVAFRDTWDDDSRVYTIKSPCYPNEGKAEYKKRLVESVTQRIRSIADSNKKEKRFVETIRSILKKVGDSYVTYRNGTDLDTFTNKHDVSFNLEKMLIGTGGSGGTLGLRYALASTYNNMDTNNVLNKSNLLRNLEDYQETYGGFPTTKEDLVEDFGTVHARCFNFGYLCYNLDEEATQLVKDLIDNYQGW